MRAAPKKHNESVTTPLKNANIWVVELKHLNLILISDDHIKSSCIQLAYHRRIYNMKELSLLTELNGGSFCFALRDLCEPGNWSW